MEESKLTPVQIAESALSLYGEIMEAKKQVESFYETEITKHIPPDVLEKIEELKAERKTEIDNFDAKLGVLAAKIRDAVKEAKVTVKSDRFMAVYTPPGYSWNGDKLAGFATAHPEILDFRTQDNPIVSIKGVKPPKTTKTE